MQVHIKINTLLIEIFEKILSYRTIKIDLLYLTQYDKYYVFIIHMFARINHDNGNFDFNFYLTNKILAEKLKL